MHGNAVDEESSLTARRYREKSLRLRAFRSQLTEEDHFGACCEEQHV